MNKVTEYTMLKQEIINISDTIVNITIAMYTKVFSKFVNDLEDLKYYKIIKVDNDGDGDKSGVSTFTIEIPVEARGKAFGRHQKMYI